MHHEEAMTRFINDTREHVMTIHRDDDVYRHIQFSKPGTNCYRYDLVTWPGYLCVTGDMGTWMFSRIQDMFEFFNNKLSDGINPGYWSEKLEAGAGCNAREKICFEFDDDAWKKQLDEWLAEWKDGVGADASQYERDEVIEKIDSLKNCTDADEAFRSMENAGIDELNPYYLFEGSNYRRLSFHFLWICYAIVGGIERYTSQKLTKTANI